MAQPSRASHRWVTISESEYTWEREALSYVRERFPDQDPFRAWTNFEFVAADGSNNEVDLLVVSQCKIYLVEIKSRPGHLSGDTGTWTWRHEGRVLTDGNPLLLANRKAKKLKSLLQHQTALRHARLPYIEPVIFLSSPGLCCDLSGAARLGVYLRQDTERQGYLDIHAVLTGTVEGRGAAAMTSDRRLRLAVASSQTAALSSRMELYPQNIDAARALKLGIGSLLGPKALSVRQIRQRIASRYPLAAPVPGPPALDDLLREAGIELLWDGTGAEGEGVYRPKYDASAPASRTSTLPRFSTAAGTGKPASPEEEAAEALEMRLQQAVTAHRFLVLTVAPRRRLSSAFRSLALASKRCSSGR